MKPFEETKLAARWYNKVVTPPINDMVIAVTAGGKTSISGVGKTSLQRVLAGHFDKTDEGFDAETKATLDAREFPDIIDEVEDGSAVIFDEAQGAPGTEGLDKRRAMRASLIDSINAALANRDKNLTIIVGAQHISLLDQRLPIITDSWLLITHGADDPGGPKGMHHACHVGDYNFGKPQIRTPALEPFRWPRVPHNDKQYRILERKKQAAKREQQEDDDEDKPLPKSAQMELAQEYRNLGKSLVWIEDNVEAITYSRETVRQNTVADSRPEASDSEGDNA